jgi:isopropylmalate/homocitrate/citramalate synthase
MESILNEIRQLHNRKNADYGDSFDKTLDEFGLVASATRMSDKFNRFKSLIKNPAQVSDEKIEDTLIDLASYAIMTIKWMRQNGVFGNNTRGTI